MRIIQRPRGAGKTFEAVQAFKAHKGDARLIVATAMEKERLLRLYDFTDAQRARILVAHPHVLAGHHGEVFVDNLDWITAMFLGEAVDVATVNG